MKEFVNQQGEEFRNQIVEEAVREFKKRENARLAALR